MKEIFSSVKKHLVRKNVYTFIVKSGNIYLIMQIEKFITEQDKIPQPKRDLFSKLLPGCVDNLILLRLFVYRFVSYIFDWICNLCVDF